MSTTMTIPAEQVALVRCGSYSDLRGLGDELSRRLEGRDRESEQSRVLCEAAVTRMGGACALLSVIGWAPPQEGEPVPVEVDLRLRAPALVRGLRVQVEAERGLAESLPEPEREPVHARVGELSGLLADATAAECDEIDDRREWHLRREGLRWVSVNGTYPMGDEGEEVHCRRVR